MLACRDAARGEALRRELESGPVLPGAPRPTVEVGWVAPPPWRAPERALPRASLSRAPPLRSIPRTHAPPRCAGPPPRPLLPRLRPCLRVRLGRARPAPRPPHPLPRQQRGALRHVGPPEPDPGRLGVPFGHKLRIPCAAHSSPGPRTGPGRGKRPAWEGRVRGLLPARARGDPAGGSQPGWEGGLLPARSLCPGKLARWLAGSRSAVPRARLFCLLVCLLGREGVAAAVMPPSAGAGVPSSSGAFFRGKILGGWADCVWRGVRNLLPRAKGRPGPRCRAALPFPREVSIRPLSLFLALVPSVSRFLAASRSWPRWRS